MRHHSCLVSLWEMLNLPIGRIVESHSYVHGLAQMMANFNSNMTASTHMGLAAVEFELRLEHARFLRDQCEMLGFAVTQRACTQLVDQLEAARSTLGEGKIILDRSHTTQLEGKAMHAEMCFTNEAHTKFALLLDAEAAPLYESEAPFGPEVSGSFPLTAEDIEEAANCLALGRYTAVVFHLMRAMEKALQALAKTLEIENVEREWGKLLSDVNRKIEAMPKGSIRNTWSEISTLLYHVKQAWRNDVMHPKSTYSKEQAKEVFTAVRSFMCHLSRMT